MTLTQIFENFLEDQILKGNSQKTVTDYRNKLRPFFDQIGELAEPHAAGRAFPAGLGMAEVQEQRGKIHGAEPRLRGLDPAFGVFIERLNRFGRAVFG